MFSYQFSARVTLWCSRAVGVIMLALMAALSVVVEQYHLHFRPLLGSERACIIWGFYACALPVLGALGCMDKLLRNILRGELFTAQNVRLVRFVRWCCLAVSIICFAAAFGFPALFFLSLIMAFLFLAVTVVGQLLKAAVALREENDLTV